MPILKANLRDAETEGIDVAAVASALAGRAPVALALAAALGPVAPADLAAMIAGRAPVATIAGRAATSVADRKEIATVNVSNARHRSPSAKSCVRKSWPSPPSR